VVILLLKDKKFKSKRQLIEAIEDGHANVTVKPTCKDDAYSGPLNKLPDGLSLCFCGPDLINPKYYGRIKREGDTVVVY
jgi:hypothetical protein